MTLIWNGDFSTGDRRQYGGIELGQKNGATPGNRLLVGTSLDGVKPPPGCSHLGKWIVKPGDQYFSTTGYRTLARQYETGSGAGIRYMPVGYDTWWAVACRFPASYPRNLGNGVWTAPFEWHHSGTQGVTPFHIMFQRDHVEFDVRGGNGSGTFQKNLLPGWKRDRWYVLAWRYKIHPTAGAIEVWGAEQGQTLQKLGEATGGTTYSSSPELYSLIGLYSPTGLNGDLEMYTAGMREYSARDEALAWARQLAGGSTTPPPPPEPTDEELAAQAVLKLNKLWSLVENATVSGAAWVKNGKKPGRLRDAEALKAEITQLLGRVGK